MTKQTRILLGMCALIIGLSLAMPTGAAANDQNHGRRDRGRQHQAWRWQREQNYYRAYPYTPPPAYESNWQQRQYIPENGEGMINPRNPNLYWACDSEGHHCNWAPRPRYRAPRYY